MRTGLRGFTLIEIMVVVVLIGLLAGLSSALIIRRGDRAKVLIAKAAIKGTLSNTLQQFYLDNQFYPTTEQGLRALVEKPSQPPEPLDYQDEGYLEEDALTDPWGMRYQYACPGTHNRTNFDLWSAGPDRQPGTGDDIVNWRAR